MRELFDIFVVVAMAMLGLTVVGCGDWYGREVSRAQAFEDCVRTVKPYNSVFGSKTPAQDQAHRMELVQECMEIAERLYPR